MEEWAKAFEDGPSRIIERTNLWWGGYVSTVWLGLDHSLGGGKPLIFETMIFGRDGASSDMQRYSTRILAVLGHNKIVKEYSGIFIGITLWLKGFKKN